MHYTRNFDTGQEQRSRSTNLSLLNLSSVLMTLLSLISLMSSAQIRFADSSSHHLRSSNELEWDEFANGIPKKELTIFFDVSGKHQHSLSITQYDVKQNWNVLLNDKKIGSLVVDGNKMRTYFDLLPEFLVIGKNKLSVQPASQVADDIVISEITIDERPRATLLSQSTVNIEVLERKTNKAIPARITIVDKKSILQETGTNNENRVAVRPGFIYTGSGRASLLIPEGEYIIYAGRGFEYSIDSTMVKIKAGEQLSRKLTLQRDVQTDGWLSSDTHIHTLTHSGHGDATAKERALTIAGEGIELPVITEHNKLVDFSEVAKEMKMNSFFTIIPGNEVTTPVGHFNVFPFSHTDTAPDHQVKNWKELSKNLSPSNNRLIILNHAQDIHNSFRPFDPTRHISVAGFGVDKWEIPANAMEIVNSGALQHDPMTLVHDWFGLLNRGYKITPVGASDSHDVSRYLVGQARTYVKSDASDGGEIAVNEVVRDMRAGKVMVSFGLLPKVTVNKKYGPGDEVLHSRNTIVDIEVAGPGWLVADRVILYANGIKIREEKIKTGDAAGSKWKGQWKVPTQKNDVFLVVVAEGAGAYLPYWPIVKPYQPVNKSWKPYTIGVSGAIWIDSDGNGKISTAYDYANTLLTQFGKDHSGLIKALSLYDEAVSVQAAASLYQAGTDLSSPTFTTLLSTASPTTRSGFRKFVTALQKTK